VRRGVVFQDNLFVPFDGFDDVVHIVGVLSLHDAVGQRGAVVDGGQFLTEVLFQKVVVVEVVDEFVDDESLLFGEMDQLGDVFEVAAFLAQLVDVVVFLNDESCAFERVQVSVDGAGGGVQMPRNLVDGERGVSSQHLHQPQ